MIAANAAGELAARGAESAAFRERPGSRRDQAFLATSALLVLASAVGTVAWCGSMSDAMPMPGGWTMSMAWMIMPGQTWLGAAASFMGMWVVMMVAMMLPSLVPMLRGYRQSLRGAGQTRLGALSALAGVGYLVTWAAVGAAAYPVGVALATAEMRWTALARAVPAATGVVFLVVGYIQLTAWKARQLDGCRNAPACCGPVSPRALGAVRAGLRLGRQCAMCCCGPMAVLLVGGVMDLGVMAAVAVAITVERVVPRALLAARATGAIAIVLGVATIARALLHV